MTRRRRTLAPRPSPECIARALPIILAAAAAAAGISVADVPTGGMGRGVKHQVRVAVAAALIGRRVRVHDACEAAHVGKRAYMQEYNRDLAIMAAARRAAEKTIPDVKPPQRHARTFVADELRRAAEAEGITLAEAATRNTRQAIRARRAAVAVLAEYMPVKDIAEALGVRPGTCWKMLSGKYHSQLDMRTPSNRAAAQSGAALLPAAGEQRTC